MPMGVDLSGQVYAAYQKALARARSRRQKGRYADAAASYRECASHLDRYVRYLSSPALVKTWQAKAQEYRQLAEKLESGKFAPPTPEEGGETAPEAYEDAVSNLVHKSTVTWADIAGLEDTKDEIRTAYVMAIIQKPAGVVVEGWRNILFYGPPGTGKTMLAAATSSSLEATFFNVRVSDLLSKYFGESAKLVSALYTAARENAPAVVFLDEIESLTPPRDAAQSGAETRIISTFLAELDGLAQKKDPRLVLTIAATNIPWAMDPAILSRFEKKIYVPLPDKAARQRLFELEIPGKGHRSAVPAAELAERTAGCNGRQISRLCKEAIKEMVQRMNPGVGDLASKSPEELSSAMLQVGTISRQEWEAALAHVVPETSAEHLRRFEQWRRALD